MEYTGIVALLFLLCYIGYPGRVRKLERKIKKLETKLNGGVAMSKFISRLIGKKCILSVDGDLARTDSSEFTCTILDSDEEWIEFSFTDKKGTSKTQLLRINSIDQIELIEEQPTL